MLCYDVKELMLLHHDGNIHPSNCTFAITLRIKLPPEYGNNDCDETIHSLIILFIYIRPKLTDSIME